MGRFELSSCVQGSWRSARGQRFFSRKTLKKEGLGQTAVRIVLERIQEFKDYPEEFATPPELIITRP